MKRERAFSRKLQPPGNYVVMTTSTAKTAKKWVLWSCCLLMIIGGGMLQGQSEPAEGTSVIDVMIKVVLSDTTEQQLRLANAQALLGNPQAHPALIDVLKNSESASAKIIICRAIATRKVEFLNGQAMIPLTFIEPLFQALKSDDPQLSSWASAALARCHDGVTDRLAQMAGDPNEVITYRLAAISTLELMPGLNAVLNLAKQVSDPQPLISQRCQEALGKVLYLPSPINFDDFNQQILPKLATTDEESFLRWQLQRSREQQLEAGGKIKQQQQKIELWQKRYFDALTKEVGRITEPQKKLEFLYGYLDQPENELRIWAMTQIEEWSNTATATQDPIAKSLVDKLQKLIPDPNSEIRRLTAVTLERMGDKAQGTAGDLLGQLKKETIPPVQAALLAGLGTFEYAPARPDALTLLDADQVEVATAAVRTLGKICGAENSELNAQQVEEITIKLAQGYGKWLKSVIIRREMILAMKKISSRPAYRQMAQTQFGEILKSALNDEEPTVRSQAVSTLKELYGKDTLALLINSTKNLLEDGDPSVRFAVIDVINSYGSEENLTQLRACLAKEDVGYVVDALQESFKKILATLPMSQVRQWCNDLQNAGGKEAELQKLTLACLADKITKAKSAGQKVLPEYEKLLYSEQARIDERENQPLLAARSLQRILALDVSLDDKLVCRKKILSLALSSDDDELLQMANLVMQDLAQEAPALEEVVKIIGQSCDGLNPQDDKQLLRMAKISVALIVTHLPKFSDEQRGQWDQRRRQIALELIGRQEKLLAVENGKDDPQIIQLLSQLDNRLKDYPLAAPVQQRQQVLQQFRALLQEQPPEKPAEPTPAPPTTAASSKPAEPNAAPTTAPATSQPAEPTPAPAVAPAPQSTQEKSPPPTDKPAPQN